MFLMYFRANTCFKNALEHEAAVIDGKIYIMVAGSDRWGTKAGVEILKNLDYIPEKPIFVDWNDGIPRIIPGG